MASICILGHCKVNLISINHSKVQMGGGCPKVLDTKHSVWVVSLQEALPYIASNIPKNKQKNTEEVRSNDHGR